MAAAKRVAAVGKDFDLAEMSPAFSDPSENQHAIAANVALVLSHLIFLDFSRKICAFFWQSYPPYFLSPFPKINAPDLHISGCRICGKHKVLWGLCRNLGNKQDGGHIASIDRRV